MFKPFLPTLSVLVLSIVSQCSALYCVPPAGTSSECCGWAMYKSLCVSKNASSIVLTASLDEINQTTHLQTVERHRSSPHEEKHASSSVTPLDYTEPRTYTLIPGEYVSTGSIVTSNSLVVQGGFLLTQFNDSESHFSVYADISLMKGSTTACRTRQVINTVGLPTPLFQDPTNQCKSPCTCGTGCCSYYQFCAQPHATRPNTYWFGIIDNDGLLAYVSMLDTTTPSDLFYVQSAIGCGGRYGGLGDPFFASGQVQLLQNPASNYVQIMMPEELKFTTKGGSEVDYHFKTYLGAFPANATMSDKSTSGPVQKVHVVSK